MMYVKYLHCPMLGDVEVRTGWQVVMAIHLDLIHLLHLLLRVL
jgi:hypothetical protein